MSRTPAKVTAQRRRALAKANRFRLAQAKLVARIRGGERKAMEDVMLAEPMPEEWHRLRVRRLLLALPGHGPRRANVLLRSAGVHPESFIGEVPLSKRAELFDSILERKYAFRAKG